MPYPNFHSVRVTPTDNDGKGHKYTGIVYKTLSEGAKEIDAIVGIYNGGSEIQAYRFPKDKWTIDEVKKWVTEHKLNLISIDPATDSNNSFIPIDGVQMARVGLANDGRKLTAEYLQVVAFGTSMMIEDGFRPKVKIGDSHYDNKVSGLVNFVYATKDGLYADIEVPQDIATEFETNPLLNDRSMEVGNGFITKDSNIKIPAVMTGIVFGVDVPADHALQSIFGSLEYAIDYFDRFQGHGDGKGETFMNEEQMKALLKPISDALTSLMAKVEAMGKPTEKPAEPNEMESDLAKAKAELESQLKTEQEKVAKFESERKTNYFDSLVKSGKIKPEAKDKIVATFDSMIKGGSTFEQASESINAIVGEGTTFHSTVATGEGTSNVVTFSSNIVDETYHPEGEKK